MRTYKLTNGGRVRTYRQHSGAVEFTVVNADRQVTATVTKSRADALPLLHALAAEDGAVFARNYGA